MHDQFEIDPQQWLTGWRVFVFLTDITINWVHCYVKVFNLKLLYSFSDWMVFKNIFLLTGISGYVSTNIFRRMGGNNWVWIINLTSALFAGTVYQVAWCRVEGQGSPNCRYSMIQTLESASDLSERSGCHQVLVCVANKPLSFGLSWGLCSRYHDIRKIGGKL